MAKKYKLLENGVFDTETGAIIPPVGANRHWQKYQRWLAEGNEPEPEFTPEELKEKQLKEQIVDLEADLRNTDKAILKLLVMMFKVGVDKGVWKKNDFEAELPGIVEKVQALRDKITTLEGLQVTGG